MILTIEISDDDIKTLMNMSMTFMNMSMTFVYDDDFPKW